MAVTGSITTRFVDEKGVDLGKTLIEKDYLISVYPNIVNQLDTPMLMGWGRGSYGALGNNSVSGSGDPIQTIANGNNWKQVECGTQHTAAVKTDGTLWCWGLNEYGQLGDNTRTYRSSPVQTVAFGTNWKQVSCSLWFGWSNLTAAIKTDGTLWTWGYNSFYGQLGDNTTTSRSSPVQTVAFGTTWKQVSVGYWHMAAIKTDGTLWTWGFNSYGVLGTNNTTSTSSPVQTVTYATDWYQVDCGTYLVGAVKKNGTLWMWGKNQAGQLGDNSVTQRNSPVQTVSLGSNWKQVSCGYRHSAAIKTDGTLWCWGYNTNGQLGDNTTTSRSSPVQTVAFGTTWKQVSCGYASTAAIKIDGTLWFWGQDDYFTKSSPIQTTAYGTTWKQVAAGFYRTFAIKDGDF